MTNNNFSKYSHVSTRKGFSGIFIERKFLRLPGHNSIEFWTYTVMYIFTPFPSWCLNSKMNFIRFSRKFQNFLCRLNQMSISLNNLWRFNCNPQIKSTTLFRWRHCEPVVMVQAVACFLHLYPFHENDSLNHCVLFSTFLSRRLLKYIPHHL